MTISRLVYSGYGAPGSPYAYHATVSGSSPNQYLPVDLGYTLSGSLKAGDLFLVVTFSEPTSYGTPPGWTLVASELNFGTALWSHNLTSAEAASPPTVNFPTSVGAFAYMVYRGSAGFAQLSDVEIASSATSAATNLAAVTPTSGSWQAFFGALNGSTYDGGALAYNPTITPAPATTGTYSMLAGYGIFAAWFADTDGPITSGTAYTLNNSNNGDGYAVYSVLVSEGSPPNAPTLTTPASGAYIDATVSGGNQFTATYNSTDGANANARALRIKSSGATSYSYLNVSTNTLQSTIVWNTVNIVPGGSASFTVPGLVNGVTDNWSMADQESLANLQGPFASDFSVNYQLAPNLAISQPAGSVTSSSAPSLQYTATPASGASVISGQWLVYPLAVTQATGSGSTTETDIETIVGDGTVGYGGDGGGALLAELSSPSAVVTDSSSNFYIADTGNARIRLAAAVTGTYFGVAVTAGDIATIAGSGITGSGGDNGPALSAEFSSPSAIAFDAAGNLLIADTNNARIRCVAATTATFYGIAMTANYCYTIAGGGTSPVPVAGTSALLASPSALVVDANENVIWTDTGSNRVLMLTPTAGTFYGVTSSANEVVVLAGTGTAGFSGDNASAITAELNAPYGLAIDAAKNLLIADTANNLIRCVAASTATFYGIAMTANSIYSIIGTGNASFSATPATALTTALNAPKGLWVTSANNVVISDTGNSAIRLFAASSGTYYGLTCTAGEVYTVAGTGTPGYSGDGGLASGAMLSSPLGLTTKSHDIFVADSANARIRSVYATSVASSAFAIDIGAGEIPTGWVSNVTWTGNPLTVPMESGVTLTNGQTYVAYAAIQESGPEWSSTIGSTFTLALDTPATPIVTATSTVDPNTGAPMIEITVTGQDNLLSTVDASFESGVGTWIGITNCSVAQSNAEALDGAYSLAMKASAAGTMQAQTPYAANPPTYPVQPNTTYTALVAFRAAATPRSCQVWIEFSYGSATAPTYEHLVGNAVTDSPTGWTVASVTFVSPSNAIGVDIAAIVQNAAAGEVHYIDECGVFPGTPSEWTRGGLVGSTAVVVTRSDGQQVRGAYSSAPAALPSSSQSVTLYDYEVVPQAEYTYTAVTTVTLSGSSTIVSATSSPSSAVQTTPTTWWLIDPLAPANALSVFVTAHTSSQTEQSTAHYTIGDPLPTVVASTVGGSDGSITVQTVSVAEYQALRNLMGSQAIQWMVSPVGDGLWVRVGPQPGGMSSGYGNATRQSTLGTSPATSPVQNTVVTYLEVSRP